MVYNWGEDMPKSTPFRLDPVAVPQNVALTDDWVMISEQMHDGVWICNTSTDSYLYIGLGKDGKPPEKDCFIEALEPLDHDAMDFSPSWDVYIRGDQEGASASYFEFIKN